ncbi:MAG: Uncharacterized protein FD144_3572 [Rhodospirillaceae bacterium]|nr:MAG: Uncharacterized protein FD144_3572 [Rhodospirillaceae bacterium]
MRSIVTVPAALFLSAGLALSALAKDRPVTEQERAKLVEAVKAAGCTGGEMEFDDDKATAHPAGKFDVDDAMCGNQKHDLVFDTDFKMLSKKAD